MNSNNSAIIMLLLAAGIFYTFTMDQYNEAMVLRATAANYSSALRDASALVELRDRLLVTYESFPETEVDRLNKMLPDNVDTVRLALDLDGMAARHGISIKSVRTTLGPANNPNAIILPEDMGVYGEATVHFSFISNHRNFMELLAELERSLRIMDVKSIRFNATEVGLYDYEVAVETYWLRQQ